MPDKNTKPRMTLTALASQIMDLTAENRTLRAVFDAVTDQNRQLASTVDQLDRRMTALQSAVFGKADENYLKDLEDEVQMQRKEIGRLRAEIQRLGGGASQPDARALEENFEKLKNAVFRAGEHIDGLFDEMTERLDTIDGGEAGGGLRLDIETLKREAEIAIARLEGRFTELQRWNEKLLEGWMENGKIQEATGISAEENGLIPVFKAVIGGKTVQVCDARTLHEFLQVEDKFATWLARRIEQYGFIAGEDFVEVFRKSAKNPQGGRPAKDYHLTLDMAKELSMLENNDKGRQIRRYFIECERKLLERQGVTIRPAVANSNSAPAQDEASRSQSQTGQFLPWVPQLPDAAFLNYIYNGIWLRINLMGDGEPWFLLKDLCAILKVTPTEAVLNAVGKENTGKWGAEDADGQLAFVNRTGLAVAVSLSTGVDDERQTLIHWLENNLLPSLAALAVRIGLAEPDDTLPGGIHPHGPLPVMVGRIGARRCAVINARKLHDMLNIGTPFAVWMPRIIAKFGFAEHVDYTKTRRILPHAIGRPAYDWWLDLDAALAVTRRDPSESGETARSYLEDCRRVASKAEI